MPSFFQGFRNALPKIVPRWLSRRPRTTQRPNAFETGFKYLWEVATTVDIFTEMTLEGVRSWLPGYTLGESWALLDPATALPLIGRSRGIIRGEAETDAAYASRLPAWLDDWEGAGSSEILCKQIHEYLANKPTVRVVDRAGNWVSIDGNGVITTIPAGGAAWTWDWDSVSNPERAGQWSDLWIIVSPCEWPVTAGTTGGGGLAAIWGLGLDVRIGHAATASAVDAIRAIVSQWKGEHTWLVAIIWNYDATLFDPTHVNAGNPDGSQGEWAYDKHDGNGLQPTRPPSARYWIPPNG